MSTTSNNLKLAFANGNESLDVRQFSVHEGMNELFEVNVLAVSDDADLDISSFVGKGGAFKLETQNYLAAHTGRAWAGVVAQMSQVHAEPAPGQSMYQLTLVPDFWRTTLRKNNRIYQHKDTPTIVKELLAEWNITPVDKLKNKYPWHEYLVQYGESDFAFVSRVLEDAGISYYFSHDKTSGKGVDITKLVLSDVPTDKENERHGKLSYAGHQTPRFGGDDDFCATVTLTQRVKPGKQTVRDFNFRTPLLKSYKTATSGNKDEDKYEEYLYAPGAFWWDTKKPEKTVADRDNAPNNDEPGEGQALLKRTMEAARRRRLLVAFHTNALDLAPGKIVGINQEAEVKNHPRHDLAPDKKLLLLETNLEGEHNGEWSMTSVGVFADVPYRPERKTPRPKIHGLQSAFVVGPAGQEVFTDEYGRVRVQFHWDREGKYDEKSSCWVRVSHGWAGGKFGMMALPRVGHEVLVEFFDGDPDHPVIAGRVYNETSPVPWTLPDEATKTGWRTNSLPSSSPGYNELVFEDAAGKEEIHFQAQKTLSYTVKNSESSSIGATRTAAIGKADSVDVGKTMTVHVGETYKEGVGKQYVLSIGKTTGIVISDQQIVLSTGDASLVLSKGNVVFDAKQQLHIHAANGMGINVEKGTIVIQGGPNVRINDTGAGAAPVIAKVLAAAKPAPAGGGPVGHPPVIPTGGGKIDHPGKVDDVSVDMPMAKEGAADKKGAKKPAAKDTWVKDHPDDLKAALKAQRELLVAKQAEIKKWDATAQANFKQYFGTTSDAAKKTISDRIQKELDLNGKLTTDNFVQTEKHEDGTYAYVYPDDAKHKIYLDTAFEKAALTGTDSKAGALSHEMSHFSDIGGTKDVVYGAGPARALAAKDSAKALNNADNFEYYIEGAKP